MSITSQQRTWILVGVLVIIGGGALVYFDPLDLNLLGEKSSPTVAKAAPPHVPAPVAKPVAPNPPNTKLIGTVASQLATPDAASAPVAAPVVAAPSKASSPSTVISAGSSETKTPVGTSSQKMQSPMKSGETNKADSKLVAAKQMRPKNLDLRHCLELDSNIAIAKCAGE